MITTVVKQVSDEMKAFPFTMIVIVALVGFAFYSVNNFASAGDIQGLAAKVEDNSKLANKIYKLQLAETLRNLHEQMCMADDRREQRTLELAIEDLQEDYIDVAGSRYPLPRCG